MARLKNKLEAVLEHIINEDTNKAAKLLHDIVVEKAKGFYQELSENDEYSMKRVGGRPDDDFTDDIRTDKDEIESDEIYDAKAVNEQKRLLKRVNANGYSVHLVQENGTYKMLLSKKGSHAILDEKAYKNRAEAVSTIKAIESGKVNPKDLFKITEAKYRPGGKKKQNESYEKYYKGEKEVDTNGEYEVGDDEYYDEDIGAEYYHGKKSVKHDGDQIDFGDGHYEEAEDYSDEYDIVGEQDDEFDMDLGTDDADLENGDDLEMDDADLENGDEPEEIEDRVADLESELEMLRQEFEEIVGKEIGDEDEGDYDDEAEGDVEGYEDEEDMGEGDYDLDEDFELEVVEDVDEGFYPEPAEKHVTKSTSADNVKSIQNQAPRENRGAKPVEFTKGSDGKGRSAPSTKDNTPSNNTDYDVSDRKGLDKNEDKTDKKARSTISGEMRAGE